MTRPLGNAHVAFHPLHKWHGHVIEASDVSEGGIPLDSFMAAGATAMQFKYPTKVLVPQNASWSQCQWVYFMSYGGGLVEGDDLHLQLDVHSKCSALLTTQASTKVFHCEEGGTTKQTIQCTLGPGALLAILPDPLIPFKHAIYSQKQRISMTVDSNLVLLDWLTAGRVARGEVWQFDSVHTSNQVMIDGETVYREALRLHDSPHVPLATAMARYQVMGTLLLLGPLLGPLAKKLLAATGKHKAYDETYSSVSLTSASPLKYTVKSGTIEGCVIKFMAPNTSQAGSLLHHMLKPLYPVLGGNPLNK